MVDAATFGNAALLKFMLERNYVSPNGSINNYGVTLLMLAAWKGHAKCVDLLLRYGAEVNCVDVDGESSLDRAVKAGHSDCVELLCQAGAALDVAGRISPLIIAAQRQHTSTATVLVLAGASVKPLSAIEDDNGRSGEFIVWSSIQDKADFLREVNTALKLRIQKVCAEVRQHSTLADDCLQVILQYYTEAPLPWPLPTSWQAQSDFPRLLAGDDEFEATCLNIQ
eukprot:g17535.t1